MAVQKKAQIRNLIFMSCKMDVSANEMKVMISSQEVAIRCRFQS